MKQIYRVSLNQSIIPYRKRYWYERMAGMREDLEFDRTAFIEVVHKYYYVEDKNEAVSRFDYIKNIWADTILIPDYIFVDKMRGCSTKELISYVDAIIYNVEDFYNKGSTFLNDLRANMPIEDYKEWESNH